jgi:hypothetical protein
MDVSALRGSAVIYELSNFDNLEHCFWVCNHGEGRFSNTPSNAGTSENCRVGTICPIGSTTAAYVHTHGSAFYWPKAYFSRTDLPRPYTMYLRASDGLLKWSPATGQSWVVP